MYTGWGRQGGGPNALYDFLIGGLTPQQYRADTVDVVRLTGVLDPAPINYRGQPARVLQPTGKDAARLVMLNAFDTIQLSMDSLMMLRDPENWYLQERGKAEVEQQSRELGMRHTLTKYVYVSKFLLNATIYISKSGVIQEASDSNTQHTISTGLPAANLSQLNIGGLGNVISASWATAGTKILDDLDTLTARAVTAGQEPPRHIWMNWADKYLLRNNTQIMASYGQNVNLFTAALRGDTLEIGNYMFHFFSGAYKAEDGTMKYYIPQGRAIITPEPGAWLHYGEGLQLVPRSLDVFQDASAALANWDDKFGDFAYTLLRVDPIALNLYAGFNMLFGLRNPSCVYAPTIVY